MHDDPSSPDFDPDMLGRLVGDKPEAIEELRLLYAKSCRDTVASLEEGASRGELARVQMAAHRLKSASHNIGALRLSRRAMQLEAYLLEGPVEPDALSALVEACVAEAEEALSWLSSLRPAS